MVGGIFNLFNHFKSLFLPFAHSSAKDKVQTWFWRSLLKQGTPLGHFFFFLVQAFHKKDSFLTFAPSVASILSFWKFWVQPEARVECPTCSGRYYGTDVQHPHRAVHGASHVSYETKRTKCILPTSLTSQHLENRSKIVYFYYFSTKLIKYLYDAD